jgi:hypothetical protein
MNSANNKGKATSSASFETYQQSVNDAWTISEDELTKEYCILSDDPKLIRRPPPNSSRIHKNPQQIAVVHKPSSTSANSVNLTNITSTTTANINNNNDSPQTEATTNRKEETEHHLHNQKQQQQQGTSNSERSIEYG